MSLLSCHALYEGWGPLFKLPNYLTTYFKIISGIILLRIIKKSFDVLFCAFPNCLARARTAPLKPRFAKHVSALPRTGFFLYMVWGCELVRDNPLYQVPWGAAFRRPQKKPAEKIETKRNRKYESTLKINRTQPTATSMYLIYIIEGLYIYF